MQFLRSRLLDRFSFRSLLGGVSLESTPKGGREQQDMAEGLTQLTHEELGSWDGPSQFCSEARGPRLYTPLLTSRWMRAAPREGGWLQLWTVAGEEPNCDSNTPYSWGINTPLLKTGSGQHTPASTTDIFGHHMCCGYFFHFVICLLICKELLFVYFTEFLKCFL